MAGIVDKIRGIFASDKVNIVAELGRGLPIDDPSFGGVSANMQAGDGMRNLTAQLTMDQQLLSRYSDYENMDDYPELQCLAGDSLVFTLKDGWISIKELAERGGAFHVLSYDKSIRSIVPAEAYCAKKTGDKGHDKPMVKVVMDNGASIRCTHDHLFMTKDEKWVEAGSLVTGQRLMPAVTRLNALGGLDNSYWSVHQPHADSAIRSSDGKRWTLLHRMVGEMMLGAVKGDVVHHVNGDSTDNAPNNLSVEDNSSHAFHHIAGIDNSKYFPEWDDQMRAAMSVRMKGNTYRRGTTASQETRAKMSASGKGRTKSEEWRKKIGESQPNRIDIPREKLESVLRSGCSISEAARVLGVSWSKVKRDAQKYDLISDNANHRVLRVERLNDTEDVYDVQVPGYVNFACNGVIVHNSVLDIFADECTVIDSVHNKTLWAHSEDRVIRDIIDDCLTRRLRMEEDAWMATRTLCKYGSAFAEIIITEEGVLGLNYLPVPTVRKLVDARGHLLGYAQDMTGSFQVDTRVENLDQLKVELAKRNIIFFEPWQMVHWSLRSKFSNSLYGYAVTDAARWVWKRLMLLEDTALVYKLERSPSRYAFYIDTGDLPPKEAAQLVKNAKRSFKKKTLVNPTTGQLDFRYNPMGSGEDFWIPTRGGKESTRVDIMSGPDWQVMDDVNYFRDKMFSAIKVPKEWFGGEGADASGALAQKDVRFARTAMRVQREFRNGLKQVVRVHLAALNIDPDSVHWDIGMAVPSNIFELQQVEVMTARANLAAQMLDFMPKSWIVENIFKFSKDDATDVLDNKAEEEEEAAMNTARIATDVLKRYPEAAMVGAVGDGSQGGAPVTPDQLQQDQGYDQGAAESLISMKQGIQESRAISKKVLKAVSRLEPMMRRITVDKK